MIIVGNKADLEHMRQVSTLEGKELAKSFGASFLEGTFKIVFVSFSSSLIPLPASAKKRQNIEEIFLDVVRSVRHKRGAADPNGKKAKREKKQKGCTIL